MEVDMMLLKLREITKTPDPEIMVLPYGNNNPEEVISWIASLSDEEFCLLMQTPIIFQAKKFYNDIRKKVKGR